jgi:hypothetical protein
MNDESRLPAAPELQPAQKITARADDSTAAARLRSPVAEELADQIVSRIRARHDVATTQRLVTAYLVALALTQVATLVMVLAS